VTIEAPSLFGVVLNLPS